MVVTKFIKWHLLLILTLSTHTMKAQNNINANESLNAQQQSIVSIAALTAVGDLEHLKTELNTGLDAGLTISIFLKPMCSRQTKITWEL
jgi:hypothetical protein